ncbi:hypothetical protein FNF31_01943 [Cafeteria roenbergensis]|uniref:PA14 domain-containing protein n=1 Tax=Cafeteria roenbergensis TaxID=33653 RepID=A0A5A8DMT1_CAFRO|nr:hypothetical protein FNF31_01943 [Cafeteria roenbergensis]
MVGFLLFAVVVAAMGAAALRVEPEFHPIYLQGSENGGTLLRIRGSGFFREGREGVTTVFIGSEICNMISYYSSDTEIWCYTPPMVPGGSYARIVISVTGVDRGELLDTGRSFQYRSDRTPRLDVSPRGGRPGQSLYFRGFLTRNSATNSVQDFDIRMGGARCDVSEEENVDYAPNDVSTSNTLYYRLRCTSPGQLEPGRYNMTFKTDDAYYGFGLATITAPEVQHDMRTGERFDFATSGHISSLSSHVGGTRGGAMVTLRGEGFSNRLDAADHTTVTLAGVPSAAAPSSRVFAVGGRGFEYALFSRGSGTPWNPATNPNYPDNPFRHFINVDGIRSDEVNFANNYHSEAMGWFIPPITANYTFIATGDDYHWLELAPAGSNREDDLAQVAGCNGHEGDLSDCSNIADSKRQLQAGEPVLFRMRHIEGSGNDYFDTLLRIHFEDLPAYEAALGKPATAEQVAVRDALVDAHGWQEEQLLSIEATYRREVQQVRMYNVESGEFTLTATVGSKSETSARLSWSASQYQVRDAIESVYNSLGVTYWWQVNCDRNEIREDVFEPTLNRTVENMLLGYTHDCTMSAPQDSDWPLLKPRSASLRTKTTQRTLVVEAKRTVTRSPPLEGTIRLRLGAPVNASVEFARRVAAGETNLTLQEVAAAESALWSRSISVQASDSDITNALSDVGVTATVASWNYPQDGRTWRIRIAKPLGDVPEIHVDTTRVSGWLTTDPATGRHGWSNAERLKGARDMLVSTIPADWTRAAVPVPFDSQSIEAANAAVMANRTALGSRSLTGSVVVTQLGMGFSCDHFAKDADAWPTPAFACDFTYSEAATPMITSIHVTRQGGTGNASAEAVSAGDVITATGTGFLSFDPRSPRLFPNGTDIDQEWFTALTLGNRTDSCNVTGATETSVTCTVAHAPAGTYPINVLVGKGRGLALHAAGLGAAGATVTYALRADEVARSPGSMAGGQRLTVRGTGFADSPAGVSVTVGGKACSVLQSSPSQVVCSSPSFAGEAENLALPVLVTVSPSSGAAQTVSAGTAGVAENATATVTSVSPRWFSEAFSGEVRLATTGATIPRDTADLAALDAALEIRFGGRPCYLRRVDSSGVITCQLPRASANAERAASSGVAVPRTPSQQASEPALAPALRVVGFGLARTSAAAALDTSLHMASVAPAAISLLGGAVLTVSGAGFVGPDGSRGDEVFRINGTVTGGPHGNQTGLVTADCAVLSASNDTLTCRVGRPVFPGWFLAERSSLPLTSVRVEASINGVPVPAACGQAGACTLQLDPSKTPQVNSAVFSPAANTLTFLGAGFGASAASDLRVAVGGKPCPVTSATSTSAVCTVPDDREGVVDIDVTVVGLGRANHSTLTGEALQHRHELRLEEADLKRVSRAGGARLTLRGYGFDPSDLSKMSVLIIAAGSFQAKVLAATYRSLEIETPAISMSSASTTANVIMSLAAKDDPNAPVVLSRRSRVLSAAARANRGRLLAGHVESSAHPLHGADLHQELLATPAHHATDEDASLHLEGAPVLRLDGMQVSTALGERATAMRSQVDSLLAASRLRSLEYGHRADAGAASRVPSRRALAMAEEWTPENPNAIRPVPADAPSGRKLAAAQPATSQLAAAFVYDGSREYTPDISSVSPSSGARGTVVTITGEGLLPRANFSVQLSNVSIGAAPCAVLNATGGNWTSTSITCTVGAAYGGAHAVSVHVHGKGFASATSAPSKQVTFTAASSVSSVSAPASFSFRGGGIVAVTGSGFPTLPLGYDATAAGAKAVMPSLKLCGQPCTVVSSSYDRMECAASNITTRASVAGLWHASPSPLSGVSSFGAESRDNVANALDGDPSTRFDPSSRKCVVGIDMGPDERAVVTRVRYFPVFRETSTFQGAVFEGAYDSDGPWETITEVQSRVNEGWNWKEIIRTPGVSDTAPDGLPPQAVATAPAYRYVRVVTQPSWVRYCAMEVEFLGFKVSAEADGSGGACSADFRLAPGTGSVAASAPVRLDTAGFLANYSVEATPRVLSVSPNNGSALGNTAVRITGEGFGSAAGSPNKVSVKLNGVPCVVQSVDASGLTCLTGRRDKIRPVDVDVVVAGVGRAAVNTSLVYFRYLDRWSELTTWLNQQPPVDGDTVIVPYGQAVLMDVSPPRLFLVLVEGEMIFDRRDLTFNASYVWINGGRLEIGTEAEPFLQKATITMHGDRWKDVELPNIGAKVLAVSDRNMGQSRRTKDGFVIIPSEMGHLDIHGAPRIRSWCRIAADASPGSRDLYTSENVDWAVGDKLVITTSSTNYQHAEELEVAEVVGPRHLRMKEPFQRLHRAQVIDGSPYGHSDVDMRAAVGLLSRNVIIQGDEGSRAQYFGVHTMAANGGIYRIENAELRNCGQGFILGRYCTHHHMSGSIAARSYVSSNSIHHSNQRISTIHGTQYYTVKHNVGYHVHGHSIFVEDGAERWNRIEENLILWTMKCHSCLKSDTKPANFWMAGPSQYHRHNYAGGSASEGFWYELPGTPHGPSATPTICPVHDHVGEFFNNTATAAGLHGLRLYPTVLPFKDPCDEASGPLPQYYVNFTSFRNGGHGIFGKENGDLHHINPKLVQNSDADLFWTKLKHVEYNENPHVVNLLAIADPDKTYTGNKVGLFGPQNEYFYVKGATFVNYGKSGAIASCAKCDSHTDMRQGGFTVRFEGLRFVNSPRRVKWTAPYKQIFWDRDGSLTDTATGGWVTPFFAFNQHSPACRAVGSRQNGGDGLKFDGGIVCDDTVVVRRMQMDRFQPNELQHQDLAVHAEGVGTQDVAYREKEIGGWVWPVVAGRTYSIFHRSLIDWRSYAMRYSEPAYVGSHAALHNGTVLDYVTLHQNWTDYRDHIEVHYPERPAADTYATERLPIERGYFRGTAGDAGPAPPVLMEPNLPGSGIIQGSIRSPSGALDQIGTGLSNRSTADHWYVLNDNNATETGRYNKHTVFVYAAQCPRVGERKGTTCEASSGPDYGAAVEPWSKASSWDDGVVPAADADVFIPPHRHILLDGDRDVGNLVVHGQLTFAVDKDLTLRANNIEVRGRMRVGTEQTPYLRSARIILRGTRTSPSAPIIHDKLWLGNKVLAVVGRLEMVGKPVSVPWTRLAATAEKGATTITLKEQVDWRAGDVITLTPTEYGPDQEETAVIKSVSGSQLVVTLETALKHRHFSGDVDVDGTRKQRLACAVGMLSRNIVVEGEMADDADTYGAHIYVAEVPNPQPLATWVAEGKAADDWTPLSHVGSTVLANVEFRNNGQGGMEAERGGLYFEYGLVSNALGNPVNEVRGCAFANSHNYGIFARGTRSLRLLGNVLHRPARSGVDIDSRCTNATLRNNLVVGVRRSVDAATSWAVPRAGFSLNAVPAELSGNVVGGSHDSGFTVRMPWCTTPGVPITSSPFSNNEAHGTIIGAFLLSDVSGQSRQDRCRQWNGFVAWKAAHIGIVTVDQSANLILNDVHVFDSHIGVSLNFLRMGTTASFAHVMNSVIAGSTDASTCDASVTCRAVGESDVVPVGCNSVLGAKFRRAGIMSSQYTNRGKTCEHDFLPFCYPSNKPERMCSMPWEKRYGLPGTRHGELHVQNTVFTNFDGDDDCGSKSRAVVANPTQVDFAPPMYFKGVTWHNVPEQARFHFDKTSATDSKCKLGCDGLSFVVVHDVDGTTTGKAGGSVISNNPELAAPSPYCVGNANWPGFRCPPVTGGAADPYTLRNFVFESTEGADRGHRRLGPLKVERSIPGSDRTRNVTSIGPIDDGCAMRFHFAQFNYAAQPGREHSIRFAATMSSTMRMHYFSSDPDEAVLASLFVQRPNVIDLFVDGRAVAMNANARVPTLSSPDGEFIFDPQGRRLKFVMRGNAAKPRRVYDIRRRPAVQLNMTLAVSAEDFVADQLVRNLAVLLSIPASRIKVVDVQAGSVAVTTAILDEQEPSTDAAQTIEQVKRLATVAKQVIQVAQQPTFSSSIGFAVQAMDMDISRPSLVEAPQDGGNSNDTNFNATALAASGASPEDIADIAPPSSNLDGSFEAELKDFLQQEGLPDNSDIDNGQDGDDDDSGPFVVIAPPKAPPANEGMSTAMVIGIAVGSVAAVAVVGLAFFLVRRSQNRAKRGAAVSTGAAAPAKPGPGAEVDVRGKNPAWTAGKRGMPTQKMPSLRGSGMLAQRDSMNDDGVPLDDTTGTTGLRSATQLKGTLIERARMGKPSARVGTAVRVAPPAGRMQFDPQPAKPTT